MKQLLMTIVDDPTPDGTTTAISETELLVLAGGVLVAGALAVWAGWLLNSHYRSSRSKDDQGKLVGTRKIDVTLARVVGLLSVGALGTVGLGMSIAVDSDLVAAYFTLLGSIAGYLIGAKTGTAQTTERTLDDTGETLATTQVQTPTLG